MDNFVLYGIAVAPLIVALVELAKRSTGVCARHAPLLALALGVGFAVAAKLDRPEFGTWLEVVILGLMAGLSASGMYSGVRYYRGGGGDGVESR